MATTPEARVIDGKKTFIPLENNPSTITELAQALGASSRLSFHDVLSVTDGDLLSFVPRPVLSLIFLVPTRIYNQVRASATPEIPAYEGSGADEPVVWIRQTIGHACGSMALIHALANGPARAHVQAGSILDGLLEKAVPLGPTERAQVLYDSVELEKAHMRAAFQGDSRPPDPAEPNGLHFIAFTKADDGRLWELEGGVQGPIERGRLNDDEDALSDKAIRLGVGKFMEVSEQAGDVECSIVAVVVENPPSAS